MTTAAEKGQARTGAQDGQSILEFLFVLPVLLGITMFMVRVNTAIQMSIVNQKYVRAQTLYISGNGADYPRRPGIVTTLAGLRYNHMTVGISEEYIGDSDSEGDGDNSTASAPTQYIARRPNQGNNDPQNEGDGGRANIRIRSTVTLCTPVLAVGGRPLLVGTDPTQVTTLGNDPRQFDFCGGPLSYL